MKEKAIFSYILKALKDDILQAIFILNSNVTAVIQSVLDINE